MEGLSQRKWEVRRVDKKWTLGLGIQGSTGISGTSVVIHLGESMTKKFFKFNSSQFYKQWILDVGLWLLIPGNTILLYMD